MQECENVFDILIDFEMVCWWNAYIWRWKL